MTKPLDGVRVADFSHVMAGPFASHILCLLGAEVIKIEEKSRGDAMRYYGDDRKYDGMSPAFIAVNAGKKSVALNLKHRDDKKIAREIIARSDVLLENFRPGVIARFGFGYDDVKNFNPSIIFCSISGYGQCGPYKAWPAIDNIVQATSGMMNLSGNPGDPPARVGFPVVDTLSGQTAAMAILSALFRRERSGEGAFIDVAMFDASLAFMASAVVPYLVTGKAPERTGNTGYSGQPTAAVFEAGDGRMISLGVVEQPKFEDLARLVGRSDWIEDPRFSDPDLRRKNGDVMKAELSRELKRHSAAEWEQRMSAAGIPCGMVRGVSEAVSFEHLAGRKAKIPLTVPGLPGAEEAAIMNLGFLMGENGPGTSGPPPRLGEHNQEILDWLRTETG